MAKKMRPGELAVGLLLGALPLFSYAVWLHHPAVLLVVVLLAVAKPP